MSHKHWIDNLYRNLNAILLKNTLLQTLKDRFLSLGAGATKLRYLGEQLVENLCSYAKAVTLGTAGQEHL